MQFYDGHTGGSFRQNDLADFSSGGYGIRRTVIGQNRDPQSHEDLNQKSLNIPMHKVSAIEIAEVTKIIENAHRFLQIAFAEELYMYCQANDLAFPELRDALNTKWNVNILEPREGIGGHCLPKDTRMFLQSSKSKNKILSAAVQADMDYQRSRKTMHHFTSSHNSPERRAKEKDQLISSH
jgi:UDP-N-acetyl-D-mannosaminuronate dehydrogenase